MKKYTMVVSVVLLTIIIFATTILFIVSRVCGDSFNDTFSYATGITRKNLIKNGNFKQGLNEWNYDKDITITNIRNATYVSIQGINGNQRRILQSVDVISGKTYRLTFELRGQQRGGFAIYRDSCTKKEQYLDCTGASGKNIYTWDIIANSSGKNLICLSTNKSGNYLYSNVSFREYNVLCEQISRILIILVLIFYVFLAMCSNKIFAIITIAILLLPIMKIDNDIKSESENRNLAIYKPLVFTSKGKRKINIEYGINFNEWLQDHFFLRKRIIQKYDNSIKIFNNRIENNSIISGKEKFFFRREAVNFLLINNIDNKRYSAISASLKRLRDYFAEKNIDLIIIITPFQEEIYKEKLIGINIDKVAGCTSNIINRLKNDLNIKIIYPYDNFLNLKDIEYVYYKTDHHWTQFGAYESYKLVMNAICSDFDISKEIERKFDKKYKTKSFRFGSYFQMLNLNSDLIAKAYPFETKYLEFEYKDMNAISGKWESFTNNKSSTLLHNKYGLNKRIFLFGDSFIRNLYPFFAYSFQDTLVYFQRDKFYLNDIKTYIENFNPNVVVICLYTQNLRFFEKMYETNDNQIDE